MGLMKLKGRRTALAAAGVGLLLLLACLAAFRKDLLEAWYLRELDSSDAIRQIAALEGLGELRSKRMIPRLEPLLRQTQDSAVDEAIVRAIIRMEPKAGPTIFRFFSEPSLEARLLEALRSLSTWDPVAVSFLVDMRIDWLPMTMNSVSPVAPLDARRMCSRSERFISAEDPRTLILRHEDGKRTRVPQAHRLLAPVGQEVEHSSQAVVPDQVQPFPEAVFGVNGKLRIRQPLLDPAHHQIDLGRILFEDRGDDPVHLVIPLIDELMPVHGDRVIQR